MRKARQKVWLRTLALVAGMVLCVGASAQQKLIPQSPGHSPRFGHAVAFDRGELAVVAASGSSDFSGFVDIYRRTGAQWQASARLLPVDTREFGYAMTMGGGWLAIASRDTTTHPSGPWPSYIDLFRRGTNGWEVVQRLTVPTTGDGYVHELVVSDNALALRVGGVEEASHVYVFDYASGTWGTAHELEPMLASQRFGWALAIDGGVVVATTRGVGNNGAITTFVRNGSGGWVHASTVTSSSPASWIFGDAIALCGGYLTVSGHPVNTTPGTPGSVSVYKGNPLQWMPDGPAIVPAPTAESRDFGTLLACDAGRLAIGDPVFKLVQLTSLAAPRTLQAFTVVDELEVRFDAIDLYGGTIAVGDSSYNYQPDGAVAGAAYVFTDVIDAIFANGFE